MCGARHDAPGTALATVAHRPRHRSMPGNYDGPVSHRRHDLTTAKWPFDVFCIPFCVAAQGWGNTGTPAIR